MTRFVTWALIGALWSFAFLSMASIGMFVVPVAAAVTIAAATRGPAPELLGLLAGAGALVLTIGAINLGGGECPSGGSRELGPGETSVECEGEVEIAPHLTAAGALMLLATGGVWWSRRRRA